jgi:putative DNA methylase
MNKKKLIEVALPLEAINIASAREKSIRLGHPNTLHLWWARRPLAAARAVIFAQMVDDPSAYLDVLRADSKLRRKAETALKGKLKLWEEARDLAEKAKGTGLSVPEPGPAPTLDDMLADAERQRLFRIIEDLVLWENTTNEKVLQAARDEIWASWRRACTKNVDHPRAKEMFDRHKLPAFHDPFAGGGALPLEAQRLGLETYASDLNPVAVLINKAMIEIPPKFAGRPPVNPDAQRQKSQMEKIWHGAQGLAEDVRYYGQWMRDEAERRIGHLYPKIEITSDMAKERLDLKPYVGKKLTVIAWLWARTVQCPNPGCACEMPLLSSLVLSSKAGKAWYLNPILEGRQIRFEVRSVVPTSPADPSKGYKRGVSGIFECAHCGTVTTRAYVAEQALSKGLQVIQTAVVAQGERARVYLPASASLLPTDLPAVEYTGLDIDLAPNPRDVWCRNFGLLRPMDLFTRRQVVALTTFCDLVHEARERVKQDAVAAGLTDDATPFRDGGIGASGYSDGVAAYLGCAISRMANYSATLCVWSSHAKDELAKQVFLRQALAMTWDFAETNPFSSAGGTLDVNISYLVKAVVGLPALGSGRAIQEDARKGAVSSRIVSTDPPYYDNIGYADLSDFFYVWMRRALKPVFPELFATLTVPKADELVAIPYRHGTKEKAETFFLDGMTQAMHNLADQAHPAFPVTIYYAFKQSESNSEDGTTNTGWDTFLAAVIQAGFAISGTWPMRTELTANLKKSISALASSIILVCRPRAADAPTATRREFVTVLKAELPIALANLQRGNIAPVDLAQAAIGPGMAVYTRYSKVLDAEGKPLAVREALALINQTLDEALAEQEGDFDADSRWALTWFEQCGFDEGEYGLAEQLSKSKNTSVQGMKDAGILDKKSPGGKVRLLKPNELYPDWNPATDPRLTAWEIVHHLIRVLDPANGGGEFAAAELVAKLGAKAETARELCYRLYTLCERKKRAAEALAYNGLVQGWPEITRLAREVGKPKTEQGGLFGQTEE